MIRSSGNSTRIVMLNEVKHPGHERKLALFCRLAQIEEHLRKMAQKD